MQLYEIVLCPIDLSSAGPYSFRTQCAQMVVPV